jgi:tetratricopeptide (TPR) repeat protein
VVEPAPERPRPTSQAAAEDDDELVDLAGPGVEVEEEVVSLLGGDVEVHDEALLHADLSDDLAHAEFLITHRFVEEAQELLRALAQEHPAHPGVEALAAKLLAGHEVIPPHAFGTVAIPAGPRLEASGLGEIEQASAEEVLQRFKDGVALAVAPEDVSTHYDLGLAYREMGLLADALAELELALGSATGPRAVDCLLAIGLCQAAHGEPASAARTLKKALAHEALTPASAAAVLYELGVVREATGDAAGAAWAFASADRSQAPFRDAAARAARAEAAAKSLTPAPGPGLGLDAAAGA